MPGTNRLTLNSDRSAQQLANVTIDYEPNPYNFSSIQLATNTLPETDRNADTSLSGLLNTLPATAAGPSLDPRQDDAPAVASSGAKPLGARSSVTSLGYRLMLPKSIKPGDISVPVTLHIQL